MTTPSALVRALGGHPASERRIDLSGDDGLWCWLLLAVLRQAPEARAEAAFGALAQAGAVGRATLAAAQPAELSALALRLEGAGLPKPEKAALTLVRAARTLQERHGGSLSTLLGEAAGLDETGRALVGLAPGLGPAVALRFLRGLRGLRGRSSAADEAPLAAPALAAAACLGWVDADGDPESALARLEQRRREDADAPSAADLEAALERLGSVACRTPRPGRCPLADACPLRYRQES
ncbi:MAG: hypothetical protein ACQGVC_15930 [Myxococcota bacterium]